MTKLRQSTLAALAFALLGLAAFLGSGSSAEEARAIPAPTADRQAGGGLQTVVLAGGCFWGVQGVYQHVEGVTSAVSGYAGGERSTARYQRVGDGDTGHAEAVRVTFDPKKVSFGKILQVFFSVAHDPTQLNRQGADIGSQYRSAIFAASGEQAKVAKAYIAQLEQSRSFRAQIATRIETGAFYRAEAYHQDYMARNPNDRYIVVHDAPKIAALKRIMPDVYRASPALVAAGAGD